METLNKPVSVLDAVKEGTLYFFDNALLILVFLIPYCLIGALFFMSNIIANPYRFFNVPYVFYMVSAAVIALLLYNCFTVSFFTLRVASRDKYFKPISGNFGALALKMTLGLLVVRMIAVVAAGVGLVLLVIPGIIIAVMFSFAGFAYVLNGGVVLSLQESRAILKGNFWKFIQLGLAIIALYIGLSIIKSVITAFLSGWLSFIPALAVNFLELAIYFWTFALYKQMMINKGFTHAQDRKTADFPYKFISAVSLILIAVFLAGIAWACAVIAPKFADYTKIEVKTEGPKSVMYIKGVPSTAVEETGFARSKWYVYYDSGKLKNETDINLMTMDYSTKEYYESGALKKTQEFRSGRQEGEEIIYDEKGGIKEKHEYKKGLLIKP